jgi:hypothetical protein
MLHPDKINTALSQSVSNKQLCLPSGNAKRMIVCLAEM